MFLIGDNTPWYIEIEEIIEKMTKEPSEDVDEKDLKDDIITRLQALLKESLNNYIPIYSANWYLNI